MLSCFSCVWLFATFGLYSPGFSVPWILQDRILEWVAVASFRGSSKPGIKPMTPKAPALQADFLPQLLSHVQLFATPWTAANQASLSSTISRNILKFTSTELVVLSNHLILHCPLLLCLQSFPASGSFQWVCSSHQVAKVLQLQLQHQTFQWIFRVDFP